MASSATVRVEKATSQFLNAPDWAMNMDICDSVNSDQWLAKDVVKAVKKRLQNRNPKVQFLALILLETMVKNCGEYVHLQIVERDILGEMIKIVRKNADMRVRDKSLELLDSWQEAFGGPGAKYPQYYWAYAELKRSGVVFPRRSTDSSPIFTPPITHSRSTLALPQAGYGLPSNSSTRLEETVTSEMGNLSLSELNNIRVVMELLNDMLQAVNPSDRGAVKDEVIKDLVDQCRANQRKLMQVVTSTSNEELLGKGLALNDYLQYVLARHDAIATGAPLPIEPSESIPKPKMVIAPTAAANDQPESDEDDNDGFAELAHRSSKLKQVATQSTDDQSDVTTASEATSSAASNALVPVDPPTVTTDGQEQDMIDFLSITLSTNPSSPTPLTPPSTSSPNEYPLPAAADGQGYSFNTLPYSGGQGYNPYNSYVAPWAQQALPPPQPQFAPYSSSYVPTPWTFQANANPYASLSTTYQYPGSHANSARTAYVPVNASRTLQQSYSFGSRVHGVPAMSGGAQTNANLMQTGNATATRALQQSYSFGSRVSSTPAAAGETQVAANLRQTGPASSKPYYHPDSLFGDLIDFGNVPGGHKLGNRSSNLSGMSGQAMISGRK